MNHQEQRLRQTFARQAAHVAGLLKAHAHREDLHGMAETSRTRIMYSFGEPSTLTTSAPS